MVLLHSAYPYGSKKTMTMSQWAVNHSKAPSILNLYFRFPSAKPGVSMNIKFLKSLAVEVLDFRNRFSNRPGNFSFLLSLSYKSLKKGSIYMAFSPLNSCWELPCIMILISMVSMDTLVFYKSGWSTYQLIKELFPAEWFPMIMTTSFFSGATTCLRSDNFP